MKENRNDQSHWSRKQCTGALLTAVGISVLIMFLNRPSTVIGQVDEPAVAADPDFVELAPYMTNLQTLTHKLSLSIEHANHQLAEFYFYESLLALEEMKTEVPEYRGQPIALLVDQLATPHYKALEAAIKADAKAKTADDRKAPAAFKNVIQSCNQCHAVTKHEFIKIPESSGTNPFLQDFRPSKK